MRNNTNERFYDLTSDYDVINLEVEEIAAFLNECNFTGIKVMNAIFAISLATIHPEFKVIYFDGNKEILLSASRIIS